MGMRNYSLNTYGMLVDMEMVKALSKKLHPEDFDEYAFVEDYTDFVYALYDDGVVEMESSFTGEAFAVSDSGETAYDECMESFYHETIAYLSCRHLPGLFSKAYRNMNEVIQEMKEHMGEYLPKDFDYRGKIVHIIGSYFG